MLKSELELVDLRDIRDKRLLKAVYKDLYVPNFPIREEQEDPSVWKPLIWGSLQKLSSPVLHILVGGYHLREPYERKVTGVIFAEFYRESECGLLTYLAVHPSSRQKGIGKFLLAEAVKKLKVDASSTAGALKAVFGEVHDPTKVPFSQDVINPLKRLSIISRLGAKLVPIRYIQPELKPGQGRSKGLLFVVFPTDDTPPKSLPTEIIRAFLHEFYRTQGVEIPENDSDFFNMGSQLGTDIVQVKELIETEEEAPVLKFEKYGIAFHFFHNRHECSKKSKKETSESLSSLVSSSEFSSFERDLVSYSYRERGTSFDPDHIRMPFTSHVRDVEENMKRIEIQFPSESVYVAEGKVKRLVCGGVNSDGIRSRYVQLKASVTHFQSQLSVFHLTFSPNSEFPQPDKSALNEYDLVKLIKLWEGGEGIDGEDISFKLQDGKSLTLKGLVQEIFNDPAIGDVRAGTIQIITENEREREDMDWVLLWESIREFKSKQSFDTSTSIKPLEEGKIGDALKSVAGIIQGLLDFRYIDETELSDVFKHFRIDETDLLGIHKGTLMQITRVDRAFSVTTSSTGVSPYLLIPHAILLHNEGLLRKAQVAADMTNSRRLKELERARGKMHQCLDKDYLPNLFHYSTERMLYNSGEYSRGLIDLKKALRAKLTEINAEWEAKTNRRRRTAEAVITCLLLLITGVQAKDAVSGLIPVELYFSFLGVVIFISFWRIRAD
jgi:GNAT superfamily N-acetyltransferase